MFRMRLNRAYRSVVWQSGLLCRTQHGCKGAVPFGRAAPGSDGQVRRVPKKEFLFLQGLAGPFFSLLGEALAASGNGVHRVNFNGGDKLYWKLPGAIDYRGNLDKWPRFLARILARRRITDILLFGDCRPLHSVAGEETEKREHRIGLEREP